MAKIGKTGRHTQARKAHRRSLRRKARNDATWARLQVARKGFLAALARKDAAEARRLLSDLFSELDRAASNGVLHRRAASRLKARFSLRLARLSTAAA